MKQERNQPTISAEETVEKAEVTDAGNEAAFLIFCFLRKALTFDQSFSIGLKSGL